MCVPGIVTSTSKSGIRARRVVWQCKNCGHRKAQDVPFGMIACTAPAICDNARNPGPERRDCKPGCYAMNTDLTEFADQQILKLQEAPELIPTGEMPRSMVLTCDRLLTDKCTPGNRVKIVGILTVNRKSSSGRGGSDGGNK